MPANPRDMIISAERRFPVRIRVGVPPGGFGQRYAEMSAWLDENCGAEGWAMTPSGVRGVLNDAVTVRWRDKKMELMKMKRWLSRGSLLAAIRSTSVERFGPGGRQGRFRMLQRDPQGRVRVRCHLVHPT
jgi:hypothetical protein